MSEARLIDRPRPGYFKLRFVKGGPFVGARIARPCACTVNGPAEHDWRESCDRFPELAASIDGVEIEDIYRVWLSGREIDEAEYRFLLANAAYERDHAPDAPAANPDRAVNLNELPPLF